MTEQPKPAEVFAAMGSAFKPDAAKGIDVVFQYNISGPNGGDWYIVIKDQTCRIEAGLAEKATTTMKISDDDFIQLITGQLNPMMAFTTGKLKVTGDMMKAQLLGTLFQPPPQ
ncbi:MAG: SCP2 sterol-binding domain-containing protein [Proteobacteria bacterium]|nr:SCP2 sterol-binding domain-containing protein [Pseudomonadota bacterium]